MIPDLIALWLTGAFANEATIASTTGLIDARTGAWAHDLIAGARFAGRRDLRGDPIEPGVLLGEVTPEHDAIAGIPVWTVASHDTASAFVAAPVTSPNRSDPLLRHLVAARRRDSTRRCSTPRRPRST
jgi:rhamnulokinase